MDAATRSNPPTAASQKGAALTGTLSVSKHLAHTAQARLQQPRSL